MTDELLLGRKDDEEISFDRTLRPKTLEQYIGQEEVKKNLKIIISATKGRGEPLEHLLFYGPPGLGKTTLANVIANEMGVNIKITSGPAIEKQGDLAAILTNLAEEDILFIDEIHRLNRTVEEILYPAMEEYKLDIIIGKGPSAKSLRLDLPKFTLIGATTRAGLLTSPLRDRFGLISRLEFYTLEELKDIIKRAARLLELEVAEDAAAEIAKRSRGTPRLANRLLRRVRDFAQVKGSKNVDLPVAKQALASLQIDEIGLDNVDRKILKTAIEKFGGGPVGLETLASAISEDAATLEDVYEPYLMQVCFLERTPRGRVVSSRAYKHLGLTLPKDRKVLPPAPTLFGN